MIKFYASWWISMYTSLPCEALSFFLCAAKAWPDSELPPGQWDGLPGLGEGPISSSGIAQIVWAEGLLHSDVPDK